MAPIKNVAELVNVSVVRGRVTVLDKVNFNIEAGETIALIGANGTGKSTLLKVLAGALQPKGGRICWFANSLNRSAAARRAIGYVGHETGLYDELTVLENLRFAARMHGLHRPVDRAQLLISQAGLDALAERRIGKLSQGIRRRVAILRALIHDPSLMLLDEPFASLDSEGSQWLEDRFTAWRGAGRSICFASHDVAFSHRLSDRIISLPLGRVEVIQQTRV